MKTLALILTSFFLGYSVCAQTAYENGMQKAFDLWDQQQVEEASSLFERIAKAEKDNWMPSYYAGYTLVLSSFGVDDETTLKLKLDKAEELLNQASGLSPNNPEILLAKALANTAYISFDGQKYGMNLSGKNEMLYQKAMQLAPENPRVILAKAEWEMGSAKFFGQSTQPYCEDVQKALSLFETEEKSDVKFYPDWGKKRAQQILEEDCKD
jgi:tetratricopeptide (TPR) repeat protein